AGGVGFSSIRSRGAIYLSVPKLEDFYYLELAINLSHELGHQALMIYQGADSILNGDLEFPVYSAIRKTNRPAIMAFHAVTALSYMVLFISDLLSNGLLNDQERLYLDKYLT